MADLTAPAWIGATDPAAHALDYGSPALTAQMDRNSDDLVGYEALPITSQRFYSPGARPGTLDGNQPANVFGNSESLNAATKLGPGSPDYIDNELPTGVPYGPDKISLAPIPELERNERDDVTPQTLAQPIAQPRAGSTSMDPTRASQQQRTFLVRPFDKLIEEHPSSLGRVISAAPFAARPIEYATDVSNPFPSAGGHEATVGRGGGIGVMSQPNTVRMLPNQWDETVVNTGTLAIGVDVAANVVSAQAAAGWRAR